MQFVDPTGDPNILHQVFVPPVGLVNQPNTYSAIVRRIPIPLIRTTNKKVLKMPYRNDKKRVMPTDKRGYIIGWEMVHEPALQSDFRMTKFEKKASAQERKLLPRWDVNKDTILKWDTLKLYGWGRTAQWEPFESWISNIYDGYYLDAGTVHIFDDFHIEGDTH